MQCNHEFVPSQIVIGTATNGKTYNPELWHRGEGIWLDAGKPRMVPCEKCVKCGKTLVDENLYWGE